MSVSSAEAVETASQDQTTPPQPLSAAPRSWAESWPIDTSLPRLYLPNDTTSRAVGAMEVYTELMHRIERALGATPPTTFVGSRGLFFLEPLVEVELPTGERVAYGPMRTSMLTKRNLELILQGRRIAGATLGPLAEHPHLIGQQRLVFGSCGILPPNDLQALRSQGAYGALERALLRSPPEVIDEVVASGLQGRGGAGFPCGLKWRTTAAAAGSPKYIVANGDEGDPGTYADRMLLEGDPHRLIEGMAIAAYAVGATEGYVYIRGEYPAAIASMRTAITQAREAGILGPRMLGSGGPFDLRVAINGGAYICGEETALLESIEGRRGMVRAKPPYPAESGLFRKPTVVNNVLTLASIPWILRNGARAWKKHGTEGSPGTVVLQLGGSLRTPCLIEVPFGLSLREVVSGYGGGTPKGLKLKAVQCGGPLGGLLPPRLLDTPVSFEGLKAAGGLLGHGGIVVYDHRTDMVDLSHHFMEFCAHESCGKCTPCRIGSHRAEELLQKVLDGEGSPEDLDRLRELAHTMTWASLCALGGLAPSPVLSALEHFPREFEARLKRTGGGA